MKNHNSIYSAFKKDKYDTSSDILKSTKNIIQDSKSFNKYLHKYIGAIQVSTFKSPDRNLYPLIRSSSIIPLNKTLFDYSSEKNMYKSQTARALNCSNDKKKDHLFKIQLPGLNEIKNLRQINIKKKTKHVVKSKSSLCLLKTNIKKKENERNCLLGDFLVKWKDNPDLKYDESQIFSRGDFYNDIINSKLLEIKFSRIENLTTELNSIFEDVNGNQITLHLDSMKLRFQRIDTNKETCITLPFAYLFLFYYKDIEYFKNILVATIKFDETYETVNFKEEEIYEYIKHEERRNSLVPPIRKSKTCKDDSKQNNKKNCYTLKTSSSQQLLKRKKNIVSGKETFTNFWYNTYIFTWVTPNINYKVYLEVPKITFQYEGDKRKITRFIERDFFLYLWNRNFMNWDFFVMNYFISLKSFRIYIENFFSKISKENAAFVTNKFRFSYAQEESNEHVISLSPRRVHVYSPKNIKMFCFVTDEFRNNSILSFYSYILTIHYNKLNPFAYWTFYLNFQQMKFLNNVSKYEKLETFLQKIINTDFSLGNLKLDFSVFEDFNYQILNYDKKTIHSEVSRKVSRKLSNDIEVVKDPQNTLVADEINIQIQLPVIEMQRYMDIKLGIIQPIKNNLNIDFLRSLNKIIFFNWLVEINKNKDQWIFIYQKSEDTINQPNPTRELSKKSFQKKLSIYNYSSPNKVLSPTRKTKITYGERNPSAVREKRLIAELKKL